MSFAVLGGTRVSPQFQWTVSAALPNSFDFRNAPAPTGKAIMIAHCYTHMSESSSVYEAAALLSLVLTYDGLCQQQTETRRKWCPSQTRPAIRITSESWKCT